jgi:hypothetical protein
MRFVTIIIVVLGGGLATGCKVRGFEAGRQRWIPKGDKNQKHDFLKKGSKAVGPVSKDFVACQRQITVDKISDFSSHVSPRLATRCLYCNMRSEFW